MAEIDSLKNGIIGIVDDAQNALRTPIGAAIGGAVIGSAVVGAVAVGVASRKSSTKRRKSKSSKKITHTKRGLKQDRKRRSKQKWEVAYQKRKRSKSRKKSKSKRGVHYTKNGQPYKIMSNGRARFIKKTKRRK